MNSGLGSSVAEIIESIAQYAGYRANVDHTGSAPGSGIFLQHWRQGLGQEERALDVDIHHLVPALFRKLVKGGPPTRSGVIHQDIDVVFAAHEFLHEVLKALPGGDITRNRHAFTILTQVFSCLDTGFSFPGGDVHPPGSRLQKTLGHECAQSAGTAGNHANLVLHGK